MAANQNFRSALNGFNREDVVQYIEYMNHKHNAQVNQLTTEIQTLSAELAECKGRPDLSAELADAQAKCVELEQELAALRAQAESRPQVDSELDAYRRAERAERIANDRVMQLCQQANGAIADATVRIDETAIRVCEISDRLSSQLTEMRTVLANGKNALKDAAASMFAVRPISTQE